MTGMNQSRVVAICIFLCVYSLEMSASVEIEPTCHSQFDYEYKVIQRLVDLEKDLQTQKQHIDELQTTIQDVKTKGPPVAFTATLSNDLASFPHNTAIVFDVIITNIGDAYSPANGIFTCKQPGVFAFYWVTTNKDKTWMNTEIVLNGKKKGTAMSDSGNHNDYSVASNTVVLDLKFGDQVWVKSGTLHSGHMAGGWRSTFTGWMIHG